MATPIISMNEAFKRGFIKAAKDEGLAYSDGMLLLKYALAVYNYNPKTKVYDHYDRMWNLLSKPTSKEYDSSIENFKHEVASGTKKMFPDSKAKVIDYGIWDRTKPNDISKLKNKKEYGTYLNTEVPKGVWSDQAYTRVDMSPTLTAKLKKLIGKKIKVPTEQDS